MLYDGGIILMKYVENMTFVICILYNFRGFRKLDCISCREIETFLLLLQLRFKVEIHLSFKKFIMIIGLDIGISSTKIVTFTGNEAVEAEIWEDGFSEKRLQEYIGKLSSPDCLIEKIAMTGVGSKSMPEELLGYPTIKVDEFDANAAAARFVCNEQRFIVVSMGSGTSFVEVDRDGGASHIGGSALGGSTIIGLFRQMGLGKDWDDLIALAEKGSLENIDMTVGDVCDEPLPGLPMDTTVTNFGKTDGNAAPEDVAIGLINMVLQNIGVMAYLAGSGRGIKTFVVFGRQTTLPHAAEVFESLNNLYSVRFVLAEQPVFMTALGATL